EVGEEEQGTARPGAAEAGHHVLLVRRRSRDDDVGGGQARVEEPPGHGLGGGCRLAGRVARVRVHELLVDRAEALALRLGRRGLGRQRDGGGEDEEGEVHDGRHSWAGAGGPATRSVNIGAMTRKLVPLLALSLALASTTRSAVDAAPPSPVRAFVGARLWDGTGRPPIEKAVLVVENGRVTAAGPDVAVPKGAERVDLAGRFVIPGLVNAHGHVGETRGLKSGPELYT